MKRMLVMFACLAMACGGDSGGGNPTSPSPPATPPLHRTFFQGVLLGATEVGLLSIYDIQTRSMQSTQVPSSTVGRGPQAAISFSGNLGIAGEFSSSRGILPLELTGTYEGSNREITMSGGGLTFTGMLDPDEVEWTGSYSGRGSTGKYAMLNSGRGARGPNLWPTHCGTFTGAGGGTLAMTEYSGRVFGLWLNAANGISALIRGQASGNDLDLTTDGGIIIQGQRSDADGVGRRAVQSGTWFGASGGGAWQTSRSACEVGFPPRGTATLFDNGSSSGPQRNLRNQAGSQEVFENFALSRPSIITTITWQQHAHDEATYHNTEVLIFRGAPFTGPSVFRATRVADRTPNATGTQFDRWDGFDYSLKGLSIRLGPGTYWLGLNNNETGNTAGWDNTTGGPHTIPGSRLINANFPAPGQVEVLNFAFTLQLRPQ